MVAVRPIACEAGPPPLRIGPADCVINAASSATFKEASLIIVERIRAFDNPSFRVKRQRWAGARTQLRAPGGPIRHRRVVVDLPRRARKSAEVSSSPRTTLSAG